MCPWHTPEPYIDPIPQTPANVANPFPPVLGSPSRTVVEGRTSFGSGGSSQGRINLEASDTSVVDGASTSPSDSPSLTSRVLNVNPTPPQSPSHRDRVREVLERIPSFQRRSVDRNQEWRGRADEYPGRTRSSRGNSPVANVFGYLSNRLPTPMRVHPTPHSPIQEEPEMPPLQNPWEALDEYEQSVFSGLL